MKITIEGSLGSGKSSVLSVLAANGFRTRPENVCAWHTLLDNYYVALQSDDQERRQQAAFKLQARIMVDVCLSDQDVDFEERCGYTQPMTFIKHMQRHGNLTTRQHSILRQMGYELSRPPRHIIHLRCRPEVAAKRILQRGRACEKEVKLDYLQEMDELYDEAMQTCADEGVKVFDMDVTEKSVVEVAQQVLNLRNRLLVGRSASI